MWSANGGRNKDLPLFTIAQTISLCLTIMLLLSLLIFGLNFAISLTRDDVIGDWKLFGTGALKDPTPHAPVPPITFAAAFNNVTEIQRLLQNGAAVDERDWVGQTALHMSAKFGRVEASEILLKNGADARAVNADYLETPLHNTAKTGQKQIFKMLLEKGADVNALAINPGFPGGTPLIYCVWFSNSVDAAKMLLDHGANVSAVRSDMWTSLHVAVSNNNIKMVQLLLKHGAQVDAKNVDGDTPLNWLSRQDDAQIPLVQLLLNYSADVNTRNNNGTTPIQNAVNMKNYPLALYLLEHGAKWGGGELSLKDDFPFVSELHFAAAFGEARIVEKLLEKYAANNPLYVDERDFMNQTALHVASMFGHLQVVKALLKWHPDVNAKDDAGLTPLHHAAKTGDHKVLQELIQNGKADLTVQHPDWGTPLATAVRFGDAFKLAIKTLVDADKTQINKSDITQGYTPLHWAITHQNLKNMEVLLAAGASMEARSKKGETPFNLLVGNVCCYPQLPAVQFLLNHGADINAKDNDGCTPLCKAKKAGKRAEVLQFLIDRGAVY